MALAALFLTAIAAAPQTSGSQAPQASSDPSALQPRIYYYRTPRSALETLARVVPATNTARLSLLQDLFSQVDCTGNRFRTQSVKEKHQGMAQNLICTWPASSPDSFVVVAHYTRHGKGQSALDDWSGAAALPALCLALQVQSRHNNWIFLESTGPRGDAEFLKSLSASAKHHIRAVIALDALGLDPTLRFFVPSDGDDLSDADVHLELELLAASRIGPRVSPPQLLSPRRWLSIDDTRPFRLNGIPHILLHTVSQDKRGWPGSEKDVPSAINANAYYDNYRTIAVYLIALDSNGFMLDSAKGALRDAAPKHLISLGELPPGRH